MTRFIFLSLAFMGWAFYEMSGGADFDPSASVRTDETADLVSSGDGTDTAVGGPLPDVATRAAIDPSIGDLPIAVVTKASAPAASAEPVVAPDRNIGNGSLRVVGRRGRGVHLRVRWSGTPH